MKTQLTKEQRQHLIELGFPKWKVQEIKPSDVSLKDWMPTITLTDLLEILPKEIEYNKGLFNFTIDFWNEEVVAYYSIGNMIPLMIKKNKELIDALYELCVWHLEK